MTEQQRKLFKSTTMELTEKEELYNDIQKAKMNYYGLRDKFMRKYNIPVYTYGSRIKKRKSLSS